MSRLPMTSLSRAASGLLEVEAYIEESGLPTNLLGLVCLRVGQITGSAPVVDRHACELLERGEAPERVWSVATWSETPYFTAEERAALRLAETATRLSDHPGGVSDEVWAEVSAHFDVPGQVALTLAIAVINAFSRIHVINRTTVGANRSTGTGASCAIPIEPDAG